MISNINDIIKDYISQTEYDIVNSLGNCSFFTKDFINWAKNNGIEADYIYMPQSEEYRNKNKITDDKWEDHIAPMLNNVIIDFTYTPQGVSKEVRNSNTIPPKLFKYNKSLFEPDGVYGKYGYTNPEINTVYGDKKNINSFNVTEPNKKISEAKKTDYSKEKSQGLHGWFARRGGGGSSGWVDCNTCRKDPDTGRKKCKPCGRQDGEKRKYPACRPTPASCGTRGKGKKWGKKSKNEGKLNEFIKTLVRNKLNEHFYVNAKGELGNQEKKLVDFSVFPEDLLKTFEYNYGHYYKHNFDWNKEQDRFKDADDNYNGVEFNKWVKNKQQIDFLKNLDKIILAVTQDIVTLKKQKLSTLKLEKFEELISPVFEKEITFTPSKFLVNKLLGFYETQTLEDIERIYREAEEIMDNEGNIDYDKITPVHDWKHVNKPKFEEFVKKNPQYRKMYDIWNALNSESINYMLKELNAFHIVNIEDLKNIYNILKKIKSNVK